MPKQKQPKYFYFNTSGTKETFLQDVHIPAWKVILFVNHWLSNRWDHKTVTHCLQISSRTSVDCTAEVRTGSRALPGVALLRDKAGHKRTLFPVFDCFAR